MGLAKARYAAQHVRGLLAVPEFPPLNYAAKLTDFNEIAQIVSLHAVREKIHGCLLQPHQKATPWLFSDFGSALILLEHLENELAYTPGLGRLNYRADQGIWHLEPDTELARRKALEKIREMWNQRSVETGEHTGQTVNKGKPPR